MIIAKVKQSGAICGGFTSVSWQSGEDKREEDEKACLFSLDSLTRFSLEPYSVVYHGVDYGPSFGFGMELRIGFYDPMNGDGKSVSKT